MPDGHWWIWWPRSFLCHPWRLALRTSTAWSGSIFLPNVAPDMAVADSWIQLTWLALECRLSAVHIEQARSSWPKLRVRPSAPCPGAAGAGDGTRVQRWPSIWTIQANCCVTGSIHWTTEGWIAGFLFWEIIIMIRTHWNIMLRFLSFGSISWNLHSVNVTMPLGMD